MQRFTWRFVIPSDLIGCGGDHYPIRIYAEVCTEVCAKDCAEVYTQVCMEVYVEVCAEVYAEVCHS